MQDVGQLVAETKASLQEYLPKLVQACDDVAAQVQGSQDTWVNLIQALFSGVGWIIDAVHGIQQVEQAAFPIDTKGLTDLYEPLNSALEAQDMVLLTDLLQYELKPVLVEFAAATVPA